MIVIVNEALDKYDNKPKTMDDAWLKGIKGTEIRSLYEEEYNIFLVFGKGLLLRKKKKPWA